MSEDEPTFEEVDQYHMALDEIERLRGRINAQNGVILDAIADLAEAEALLREVSEGQKDFNLSWATLDAINAWLARRKAD